MCYQTKLRPKAVWFNTITLAICFALFAAVINYLPAAAQDGALSPEAQRILDAVNQARVDNGLPPLALNVQLNLAAQNHVDDVIANGNWGHYGSDGSTVAMRAVRAGYSTSTVSENWVAASTPEQAMDWWLNDWIHRVNILTGRWDEIGIGAAPARNGFWIFVTDFGDADGVAAVAAQALGETAAAIASPEVGVESVPAAGMDYSIRAGDTLLGIGLRYGIDWQDIALANNMAEADVLAIGQVIRLPGRGGASGDTGIAAGSAAIAVSDQTHIIRPGETLWTIAARYGVTWEDVAAVNDLGEYSLLQIGQELKLPATAAELAAKAEIEADSASAAAAAASDDTTAAADATLTGAAGGEQAVATAAPAAKRAASTAAGAEEPTLVLTMKADDVAYAVRPGDTLSGIAARHDVTWQNLAAANGLTEDSYLQIGQELTIPGTATEPLRLRQITGGAGGPVQQPVAARAYTVQPGDTIFAIAMGNGVDWQELLLVNNLTEASILQPGQTIQLP